MKKLSLPTALLLACAALPCGLAAANTSHAGWPMFNGDVTINKTDASGTITGQPGAHNELLGGHGNDTINAGNAGDVLWGDYKPSGQPTTQVDHLNGGTGKDFIYASHGTNYIRTGGGADVVHAHYGRGQIRCDSKSVVVYLSHKSKPHYKLTGCKHISFKSDNG